MKTNKLYTFFVAISLLTASSSVHTMHHAKTAFHKACTGISYAIQGSIVYTGLRDLSAIANAKYGIGKHPYADADEFLRNDQDHIKDRYKYAVPFIQETLRNKGQRDFNDPDRYKDVLLSPSESGRYGATAKSGKSGVIFFDERLDHIICWDNIMQFDNNQEKHMHRWSIEHEIGHLEKNHEAQKFTMNVMLPFAVHVATQKIKAPLQAFTLSKKLLSSDPSYLQSIGKIPGACIKLYAVEFLGLAACRKFELDADLGTSDDKEQLMATKNNWELQHRQALDRLAKNEYDKDGRCKDQPRNTSLTRMCDKCNTRASWNVWLSDHPLHMQRVDVCVKRINALENKG